MESHRGTENGLAALNRITEQGAEVAVRGQADSRTLKALTLTATLYLPATLLAVISILSPTVFVIMEANTPDY